MNRFVSLAMVLLMTSFTIILALLPAALGYGAGSDTNAPLAVAVIGGMVSSTLLTLIVVPAVYSLVENGLMRTRAFRRRPGKLGLLRVLGRRWQA